MESLDKHVKKLSQILDSQYKIYKKVFELVKEEKTALVNADLDTLTRNLKRQQDLISTVNKLEKDRLEELEVISIFLGTTPQNLKIATVAQSAPGDYPEILTQQETKFKLLLEEILRVNKSNKFLINNSLQFIDKNIQVFFGAIKEKGIYENPASKTKAKPDTTRLLDRKI